MRCDVSDPQASAHHGHFGRTAGPQFHQFLPQPCLARGTQAWVADHATRLAGQDRCQDHPPWALDRLPDGGGHGAASAVPADPCGDRHAASINAAGSKSRRADGIRHAGRRRPPNGRTRHGSHPGAVTVACASGAPIGSRLDGWIGRPCAAYRPSRQPTPGGLNPAAAYLTIGPSGPRALRQQQG